MEAMNAVIVAMKKLICAVKNCNQCSNSFDLIFLIVTNNLFQRIGHVEKDNLCAGKLIPNALQIHKSAMDTKIALTEAMRVKAYAVRISGFFFHKPAFIQVTSFGQVVAISLCSDTKT